MKISALVYLLLYTCSAVGYAGRWRRPAALPSARPGFLLLVPAPVLAGMGAGGEGAGEGVHVYNFITLIEHIYSLGYDLCNNWR
jgi:hypothetical protein